MRKITDERLSRQAQEDDPVKKLSSAQRAALAVAKDYPVFPCAVIPREDGKTHKKPWVEDWPNVATQDAAIVTRWWRKYPDACVGVPMGSRSGLVAIDIDPRGRQWFAVHRKALGTYQLNPTVRGRHLVYRYPADTSIRNTESKVADGVDVRGEGGFLLWWPAHGFESIGTPGELPDWLLETLTKHSVRKLNGHAHEDASVDWLEERKRVIEALGQLDPDLHHDEWRDVLAAISNESNGAEDGENIAVAYSRGDYWSAPATTFPGEQAVRKKYRSFKNQKETNITIATLFKMVKDRDGKVPAGRPDKRANGKETGTVLVSCSSDIRPRTWIWEGHIEKGVYHLLSGVPGTNKTCTVLSFAATITSGGLWPDGTRWQEPANVVMWSGEDDIETTLRPRLLVCGGDWRYMHFVSGMRVNGKKRRFSPARDMEALIQLCKKIGNVKLVIIDSVSNAIVKDSHNDSEVRQQLEPLLDFMDNTGAALFGISHFTKGSKGGDPLERIMGSRAMGAVPRGTYSCTKIMDEDHKDTGNRLFSMLKTQFAKEDHSFEYRVEDVPVEGNPKVTGLQLVWGKRVEGSAAQLINEAEGNGDGESKLGAAKKVLRGLLASGSASNFEIAAVIEKEGISNPTYRRAREDLKLVKSKAGKNMWRWSLPDSDN